MHDRYLVVDETFGHGSFGKRCEVCNADSYRTGEIEHKPGCEEVTEWVIAVRDGRIGTWPTPVKSAK